jgi:hypothetical protein
MTFVRPLFYDRIGQEQVNEYSDHKGNLWMATGKRAWFRVRMPK